MALDSCLYILGEVSIHDRCRVLGQECDAFGDGPAGRGGRMDHRHRQRAVLDHDLRTGAHPCQHIAKLLAASASEMWITWLAMARLYRHSSSSDSDSNAASSAAFCASSPWRLSSFMTADFLRSSSAPGCVVAWICCGLRIATAIDFRGRGFGVSEHLLDVAKVRAARPDLQIDITFIIIYISDVSEHYSGH